MSTPNPLRHLLRSHFAGREDVYAIRREKDDGTVAYVPSTDPSVAKIVRKYGTTAQTDAVLDDHLNGTILIGVYPIRPDNTVSFFAFDFDQKSPEDPPAFPDALKLAEVLTAEAGLSVAIERSQGGKGYHVWGFLTEPLPAATVRHALSPFIEEAETYDRMYPSQAEVAEGRFGNLIALPWQGTRLPEGKAAFVHRGPDGEPVAISDQATFLADLDRIDADRMRRLFTEAGQYTPVRIGNPHEGVQESMRDSWKLVHPIFGDDFIRWCYDEPEAVGLHAWYALACQFAKFVDGRDLFHEWSQRDPLRYDARHADKVYNRALRQNKPHGCKAIRALGAPSNADARFSGHEVYHPYDVARLPLSVLLESVETRRESATLAMGDGLDEVFSWLAEVQEDPTVGHGVPTGIEPLDRVFGYREGELTVVAARTSRGKTALAMQLGVDAARNQGMRVKTYEMEMTRRQAYLRVASGISGVSQTRMTMGQLTHEDWRYLKAARNLLAHLPFEIDDRTLPLDTMLEDMARFTFAGPERALFVVDYVQIIPRLSRETEQDAIVRAVTAQKRFAKIFNVHVLLLCQMNRQGDDSTVDSAASDSWLRGSDVLAFVPDNLLFLLGEKGPGVVERTLIVHKQRNGEAGINIRLEFNQPLMRMGPAGTWGLTQPEPNLPHREGAPRVAGGYNVAQDPLFEGMDDAALYDAKYQQAPADHPALGDFEGADDEEFGGL